MKYKILLKNQNYYLQVIKKCNLMKNQILYQCLYKIIKKINLEYIIKLQLKQLQLQVNMY